MSIRDRYNAFIARHEVAWELAFAALAIAFVALGFAIDGAEGQTLETLLVIDWVITAIFAAEFATRFAASRNRRAYLRGHWIDVFALIPAARGLRVLRLLRLLRVVRAFAGIYRALKAVERIANHRGLAFVFTAWLAVMVITSMILYAAENGVNEAINDPVDAIWWGVVTLSTVGYGDVVPVTNEGRFAAAVLMLLGIGLFSAITATVTSFMLTDDEPDLMKSLTDLRKAGVLSQDEYVAKVAAVAAATDPGLGEPMSLGAGEPSVRAGD
jgi:voltage-gated potassium channel